MISNALVLIRFNQSEMKRLYRIFKSECPSGLITEEVFHNIFSKFFPLGAESYNGKRNYERFSDIHFTSCHDEVNIEASFVFCVDRNSPDYAKLASFWCLLYRSYQICDMHIPYSNLFDLFSFPANVSSYSHYVFSALVQDDSEVITFEVNFCLRNKISIFPFPLVCALKEFSSQLILSIFQDFVVGLSVLVNGTQEEKLEWTFHLYDLDGDGVITREEMEDVAMSVSTICFYDARTSWFEWDFIANISLLNVT